MERVVGRASVGRNPSPYLLVGAARGVRSRRGREKWCAQTRRVLIMKMFTAAAACFGTFAVTVLGMAGETPAGSSTLSTFVDGPDTGDILPAARLHGYSAS